MAATDQSYRSQYTLDIVFAVTSILMLLSTVWMLVDDYRREYKTEQRIFRDVEVAIAQREALNKMPTLASFEEAAAKVEKAKVERRANQKTIDQLNEDIANLLPDKERAELKLSDLKARLDSKKSFYDIEVDHNGPKSAHAIALKDEIVTIEGDLVSARNTVEDHTQKIKDWQREKDAKESPLTKAIANLKKLLDDFDRQVNLAIKKQWGLGDDFRALPVIDGFASPTKIEQITLHDLTIDYNFKGVTRFDRCTTCHKGIARPTYTKENLEDLWYGESSTMTKRLEDARTILGSRKELLAGLDEGRNLPNPKQLESLTFLSDKRLTPARVGEFRAHPRLDLFVGPNSKHPSEKFGCTSCHSGQPSGTGFTFAAHTPNDSDTLKRWKKEHDWEAQHMWDFPMLPQRFIESSCIKCHHQVTDLYSDGNKTEAPKVLKGYNLIREFGCFGCHEISGYKGGRSIGPDLRLEPSPPLESLSPGEAAKLMSDPDNPPGLLRKVGPSLYRVSEKTNEAFAVKWIMAPREFRPDTKMPHYYGLSNNDAKALKGTGQENFPATEVHGIAHFLFKSSREYLNVVDEAHQPTSVKKARAVVQELQAKVDSKQKLSDAEARQLQAASFLLSVEHNPPRLGDKALSVVGDLGRGRDLFSKRGCQSCHTHAATYEADDKYNLPPMVSEADFGPNLTQLKEKLVPKGGKTDKATIWLVNWLKNPTIHSPRTRMPITHLIDQEAADIAAWLLAQDIPADAKTGKIAEDLQGAGWATMNIPAPEESDLKDLATVYLGRVLAASEVRKFFTNELPQARIGDLGVDEKELAEMLEKSKNGDDARKEALLHYVGKKAVSRLGCYACHDIPGFDTAKPIGTPLADWGKKDPGRLAFEDITNYVKEHYPRGQVVESLVDEDGYPRSVKNGPLYERFFYDALLHQSREGYLNQKLLEPRSYDFNRIRPWDDRARMPQFKFGRVRMKPEEDPADFKERINWAEAMSMPVDKGMKPRRAESADDYRARKALAEAENREAVETFILGLVGEPIPLQYLNQPTPERLAEVKGRQVLDKFNCAGCHVVRPGVFEFNLTERARRDLEAIYGKNLKEAIYKDDYFFPEHRAWAQPLQGGDVAVAHGVRPLLSTTGKKPQIRITLTDALDLPDGKGGHIAFRATDAVSLQPGSMIWPPWSAFRSPETFKAWDREHGAQGGAFAALLGGYLKDDKYQMYKDRAKYVEPGPNVPPQLIWQGERTQPGWLFQFLLDPQKVRESTVLRMPKFNMSEDEARMLVNYFAAIEKRFNPDTGITQPYPKNPQRATLDTEYWRSQTAKYVDNLKKSGQYQKEVDALQPVWSIMIEDWKKELKTAEERKKTADEAAVAVNKALADAKDDKQKESLKKKKEDSDNDASRWKLEKERLGELVAKKTLKVLEEDWNQTEAYALAGQRLLVNQCNKCHVVGNLKAQQELGLGPSLNLAADRLRPEWTKRWIANPQRFIPYNSAMPAYFKRSDDVPLVIWLPGSHFDQIEGARDALLNLPRINELPITRNWMQSGGK